MKKKLIGALLLAHIVVGCGAFDMILKPAHKSVVTKQKKDKVVCLCVPKSGTHLLTKCLSLLGDSTLKTNYATWDVTRRGKVIRKLNKLPPPNHFKGDFHIPTVGVLSPKFTKILLTSNNRVFGWHTPYTKEYNAFLDAHVQAKFVMIRDPRAMLVSFAYMVSKGFEKEQVAEVEPILLDLIDGRQKYYVPWATEVQETYPVLWEVGIVEYYKQFLPFIGSKNCMLVKFEDLVGERGGGSKDTQIALIQQIAAHVGIQIDTKKAMSIAKDLFGGSGTFREGKIDGWKKHFTQTIKQVFKNTPGANQLLIDLGYEKDSLW